MKFSDIADIVRCYGKARSDNLIILPILREYDVLFKHLGYLSRQSSRDFDLIIVLNSLSDESKVLEFLDNERFDFSISVSKRKEDTGAAGGYSAGQKYALEKGYGSMIIADSGCFPVDEGLVENLLKHRDKDYVCHPTKLVKNGKVEEITQDDTISWYSLFSSKLVKKHGIVFTPLYFGYEDVEYKDRIGTRPYMVENHAQHPLLSHFYQHPDKYSIYVVNGLFVGKGTHFLAYFISAIVHLSALLIFSPPYGRKAHNVALSSLLSYGYGKPLFDNMKCGYENYITDAQPKGFKVLKYMDVHRLDGSGMGYLKKRLKPITDFFMKDVMLDDSSRNSIPVLISIFSKKAFCKMPKGGYLLMADNSDPIVHALKLLLFMLYLPLLTIFLLVVYLPLKLLKEPDTRGYGLD